jgi:hypothetical protein
VRSLEGRVNRVQGASLLVVTLGIVAVVALAVSRPAGRSDGALPSPAFDIAGILGIAIQPLPANAHPSAYDLAAATRIATSTADLAGPIAVDHGVVDGGRSIGRRNAWVLLFKGGNCDAVPGGPYGAGPAIVDYSGIAIDDLTGAVLVWISDGHR